MSNAEVNEAFFQEELREAVTAERDRCAKILNDRADELAAGGVPSGWIISELRWMASRLYAGQETTSASTTSSGAAGSGFDRKG